MYSVSMFSLVFGVYVQVLAEEGKAKAVAFDEIDKAPEEKKRGITIATVGMSFLFLNLILAIWSCQ